jgi:hypothetical protein
MGGSAGAHALLHLAYLDEKELPSYYNKTKLGSLEGMSGMKILLLNNGCYQLLGCYLQYAVDQKRRCAFIWHSWSQ